MTRKKRELQLFERGFMIEMILEFALLRSADDSPVSAFSPVAQRNMLFSDVLGVANQLIARRIPLLAP